MKRIDGGISDPSVPPIGVPELQHFWDCDTPHRSGAGHRRSGDRRKPATPHHRGHRNTARKPRQPQARGAVDIRGEPCLKGQMPHKDEQRNRRKTIAFQEVIRAVGNQRKRGPPSKLRHELGARAPRKDDEDADMPKAAAIGIRMANKKRVTPRAIKPTRSGSNCQISSWWLSGTASSRPVSAVRIPSIMLRTSRATNRNIATPNTAFMGQVGICNTPS
jgi:hypothetical protein